MLVIRLLGGLALETDGRPIELPSRRHGQALLGYLALHPGLHGRGFLASLLWPDVLDASARSSLRSALSSVRRALGDDADTYLVARRDRIGLVDEAIEVDVRRFRELVVQGELESAVTMDRGVLLQGLDDDWIEQARREHREQVGEALAELAAAAEARGEVGEAIRLTREGVALDPLGEAANRELIRRLAAAGDRAAALAAYSQLIDGFRTQLRSVPSSQTRELAAQVRADTTQAAADGADVEAPPLPPALRARVPSVLVGRTAELHELRRALERAESGERQIALIAGEPGIGKSALLARLAASASQPVTVLFGRCGAGATGALSPFVEALRRYVVGAPADHLMRELPPAAAQLVGLIPELAESAPATGPGISQIPLGEGGRLTRAVAETMLGICATQLVMLAIEDVHDADPDTLRALAHLATISDSARLLVCISYRDAGADHLEATVHQLRRLATTRSLLLAPLNEEETAELARATTRAMVSPSFARELHRHSGGNPLFAEELVRRAEVQAAREGRTELAADELGASPLPERVSDLIVDDLSRLQPATRRALSTASALGDEFELGSLRSVTGMTDEECLDALDDAVAAKALREVPQSVGRFQFRHPLIRETLYSRLTATRRAHLHLRIAEALQESGEPWNDVEIRAIAEHLAEARELASRPKLAEFTVRAARAAEAVLAHDDAIRLFERAVALETEDPAERCRLLLALGRSRRRAGESEEARDAYQHAASLARGEHPDLFAEAALGVCAVPGLPGQKLDSLATSLLREALDATPVANAGLRARLLAQLAAVQAADTGPERVGRLVEEAEELARNAGDSVALSGALDVAHMLRRGGGDPSERLRLADELLALADEAGDAERVAMAHVRRSADLLELGDFAAVRQERDALIEHAAELRQPAFLWWARLWEATEAILRGAHDPLELVNRARATGSVPFGEAAELERAAQMFWMHLEAERLDELGAEVVGTLGQFASLPAVVCANARIDVEVGRLESAAETLERLSGPGLAQVRGEAGWPLTSALLAEVCARVGDPDSAHRLRVALEPAPGRWASSSSGSLCLGPQAGSLALLYAVEGAWEESSRCRQDALERCAKAGAAPAAARLERELARLEGARSPQLVNRGVPSS